jgi:hypothetical protein
MNGLNPFGTFAAYSASKFAVLGMSDALRQELAPHGVGVSTLFPGLTRSRMSLDPKAGADVGAIPREVLEANMMQPVWLGRAVARAIENNAPYLITHPDYKPNTEARFREILSAFGEPAQPGYKTGATARRCSGKPGTGSAQLETLDAALARARACFAAEVGAVSMKSVRRCAAPSMQANQGWLVLTVARISPRSSIASSSGNPKLPT